MRKDLVLQGTGNTFSKIGFITGVGGNGWREAANPYPGLALITADGKNYRNLTDTEIASIAPMGYPEDKCHAFRENGEGDCTDGRIGDGDWDRYAYFRSNPLNYPTVTSPTAMNSFLTTNFGTTTPTRYQVYLWEMANSTDRLKPEVAPGGRSTYSRPSDLAGEPGGVSPSSTQIDRRVLAVAVINCAAEHVGGHTVDVNVKKWIEMFLVQPSVPRTVGTRTDNADVYVEVIGLTQNATDEGAVQLVKKSVPYLIE
jgi:hypothetical protein